MDIDSLAASQGFATDEFLEIVDVFIDVSRSDVVRMAEAIENQDAATAGDAAHSLKGAAGNLGFFDLFEAAKKAETQAKANDLGQARETLLSVRGMVEAIARDVRHKDAAP